MAYNPGIEFRGGELIGSGLMQAGNALARGFEKRTELKREDEAIAKREREREKRDAEEYDALSTLFEAYGLGSKDQAKTDYNLGQLRGVLQGHAAKTQEAERAQRTKLLAQQLLHAQDANQRLQDRSNWMGAFANRANQPGPVDLQSAFMDATKQFPKGVSEDLLPSIMHYGQAETGGNPSIAFEEDPVSGERFATFGRQMAASGRNPAKETSVINPKPIRDPESGKLLGYSIGQRFLTAEELGATAGGEAPTLIQMVDNRGQPVAGMYWNPKTGKPIQVRTLGSAFSTPIGRQFNTKPDLVPIRPMTLEAIQAWKAKRK